MDSLSEEDKKIDVKSQEVDSDIKMDSSSPPPAPSGTNKEKQTAPSGSTKTGFSIDSILSGKYFFLVKLKEIFLYMINNLLSFLKIIPGEKKGK